MDISYKYFKTYTAKEDKWTFDKMSHSVQWYINKDWRFFLKKSLYILQKCSESGNDGLDVGKGWGKQVIIKKFVYNPLKKIYICKTREGGGKLYG